MQVTTTKELNVLPILISDFTQKNLERIRSVITNNPEKRDLRVHNYEIVKEGVIVLVGGNIGNYLDFLLVELSGVDKEKYEYQHEVQTAASETVKVLSDDDYYKKTTGVVSKNPNLNNDLSSLWD